jgi:hypothetical protein
MKEVSAVERREEVKQEPKSLEAPKAESPKAGPRPRRFRIVKLEERIAPLAGHRACTEFESNCI